MLYVCVRRGLKKDVISAECPNMIAGTILPQIKPMTQQAWAGRCRRREQGRGEGERERQGEDIG